MTEILQVILLVDESLQEREIYRRYLLRDQLHTYQILEAETGKQALLLCQQQFPDVIVIDYLLPDMDGLEFLSDLKIRLDLSNLPVIMLTDQGNEQIALQAMKNGAAEYLIKKNITAVSFRLAIQKVLEKTRLIEQLEKSEKLYRSLVESQTDLIVRMDMNGRLTFANAVAGEIFGFKADEFFGQCLLEFVHPEDLPDVMANIQSLTSPPYRLTTKEQRGFTVNGIRWFQWEVAAIRNQEGQVIELQAVGRDVTKRKQAEQKIHEQAALIDISPDAIFVRNLDYQILFWSKGAERLYGWTSAEILGKESHEFLYKQTSPQIKEAFRTVVEQGEWCGDLNKMTKSGQELTVSSRWTLMYSEDGQPESILTVDTDITEKKRLEQQFYRAQRLESLGILASGIAHDLNNILSPILTVAQLLLCKLPSLDEKNRQLLKILEHNSKRGAELVKQITSFARGSQGKQVPLQIRHLLKEIEQIISSTFSKSIEICTDIPTQNLLTVWADPTQIHQVLMNLCVNAYDAMPDGGILSISAENFFVDEAYARMNLEAKVGSYVLIAVSDTGSGIPKNLLERIFEPFFTTKELSKGTGLGLSTAIGIVKNHRGFVTVDSEVGKGSQFNVYLPAIEQLATQEIDDCDLPRGNDELVLVVDDEDSIQEVTKTLLEDYNYKTISASNGVEAISVYTKYRDEISLVLMDIQMPSIDGLMAIRVIQQINPSVKIIAISGFSANSKLLEVNSIGVQAFLLKPYTINKLLETIQSVLKPAS
ncbi:hybrid sensor histidine kinase/response regulator [Calothrix sp. NIES-2098]|uniref:hybrid sensor histidine kinase/response regulator n=1 Tax=Calothrix sp. NIES-2098 TaxID=1954171 RepID=UPI000B608115|nr:multi-sensor hybrid histidine kinase [Calothrix sp. NIES-2098]